MYLEPVYRGPLAIPLAFKALFSSWKSALDPLKCPVSDVPGALILSVFHTEAWGVTQHEHFQPPSVQLPTGHWGSPSARRQPCHGAQMVLTEPQTGCCLRHRDVHCVFLFSVKRSHFFFLCQERKSRHAWKSNRYFFFLLFKKVIPKRAIVPMKQVLITMDLVLTFLLQNSSTIHRGAGTWESRGEQWTAGHLWNPQWSHESRRKGVLMLFVQRVTSRCRRGDLLLRKQLALTSAGRVSSANVSKARTTVNLTHFPKRSTVLIFGADPSLYRWRHRRPERSTVPPNIAESLHNPDFHFCYFPSSTIIFSQLCLYCLFGNIFVNFKFLVSEITELFERKLIEHQVFHLLRR